MDYTNFERIALSNASQFPFGAHDYFRKVEKILYKFAKVVKEESDNISKINFLLVGKEDKDIIYGGETKYNLGLIMYVFDKNNKVYHDGAAHKAFVSLMEINHLPSSFLNLGLNQRKEFSINIDDNCVNDVLKGLIGEEVYSKLEYLELKSKMINKGQSTVKKNKI